MVQATIRYERQRGLDAALSRLAARPLASADLQGDRQLRRILNPPAL